MPHTLTLSHKGRGSQCILRVVLEAIIMFKKTGLIFRIMQAKGQLKQKSWYLSKTVWFNLLTLTFSVLAIFGGIELGVSDDEVNSISIAAVAVANIVLRFLTAKPIMQDKSDGDGREELDTAPDNDANNN